MSRVMERRNLHKETWRWSECQSRMVELRASFPREEPQSPSVGQGWFDDESELFYLWDGRDWIAVPAD